MLNISSGIVCTCIHHFYDILSGIEYNSDNSDKSRDLKMDLSV